MKTLGFLLLILTLSHLSSHLSYCQDTVVEESRPELQVDCQGYPTDFCTAELHRMCGSDGRTYGNKCSFCNAVVKSRGRLSLIRYGPCDGAVNV
ncbi:ovomucoid-like [Zootoca vivipara]|uniref:ovomucoid-like n=1 Tax=Zootoca vivipara TaxID=8524 RepID=UPI00293C0DB4|nr:ovomucoid-like [Zootoca vivipara]